MECVVLCITCRKVVEDPSLPCPGCGTSRNMVDRPKPKKKTEPNN